MLAFVLLWWVIAEGTWQSHVVMVLSILAAVLASLWMTSWRRAAARGPAPPGELRWRWHLAHMARLPRLCGYFLLQSLLGGVDVARRALAPSLPLQPGLLQFELRLAAGFPQVLFAWLVSLTPGTLAVRLHDDVIVVHALDSSASHEEQLRRLETHVAAVLE